MNQNLTISLESVLMKKLKVLAAQKDMSVSRLLREQIQKLFLEEGMYGKHKARAFKNMDKGLNLGGGGYYSSRDELHERKIIR